MTTAGAWTFLIVGFVLPLIHVGISPKSGPWKAPPEAGCPIGPRWGWLVIILFLGPIGWLMFIAKTRSRAPSRRPEDIQGTGNGHDLKN